MRATAAACFVALGPSAAAASLRAKQLPARPPQPMGFFITSAGPGNGANLGGLAGADRHCQSLAAAVGAGNRTWHPLPATEEGDR